MKQVLNTPLVNILSEKGELTIHVKMSNSKDVLILNPIKEDLQGYIQALTIAQEILAGKFWPSHVKQGSTLKELNKPLEIIK